MNSFLSKVRKHFFQGPYHSLLTLVLGLLFLRLLWALLDWALVSAQWTGTASQCRETSGACWSFVREKVRFILLGYYPTDEHWRGVFTVVIFLTLFSVSQFKRFWSRRLFMAWVALPFVCFFLMWGGIPGLPRVEIERFSGLPLTLMLSLLGIAGAYPLGILLALGRRSEMPLVRLVSTAYIEFIRGIPLISILFMASLMFPLFLPEGMSVSKIVRAQVAIILFSGAYMAEVVRGGLQAIPRGQYEGALSLGLTYPQMMGLVILPQALKIVIPPTVNTFVSLFKDTSLVFIISLADLMFTTKLSFNDGNWLGFTVEGYVFIAALYFIFCYFLGRVGHGLEGEVSGKGRGGNL